MSTKNLAARRDKLKVSARVATKLARSERQIADDQHAVASQLEVLAQSLDEQVVAIEVEMQRADPDTTVVMAKTG